MQATAGALRKTLDEQMFWIPSNKSLEFGWIKALPGKLKRQIDSFPWGDGVRELGAGLVDRPLLFLPLLLLIVLLAVPGALFLALCGFALQMDARGQNANLGTALFEMAQAWLVFYTAYRILAPGGVAELHFHWTRPQVSFLHAQVRRLGLVVMALVAVVTVAEHQPAALAKDVIGVVVVLTCYALMAWLLGRLLFNSPTREHASPFRLLIGALFTALPIALIFAVGFGYYYTALQLSDRLIDTLYLLMLWLVVEATLVRGLGVAARRLAYQRALAKRNSQAKEGPQ